jgi:hypothetical protein
MNGLFEAADQVGAYTTAQFPLADIEAIRPCAQRKGVTGEWWTVRRRGNLDCVYLSETMWQALMRRPVQLMPVDPAYSIVRFGCDSDGAWSMDERILAWALCWDGEMRPVARDGVDAGLPFWDPVYIRMPDGTLDAGPHCDRIDSVEEGIALARREWEAKNSREVKA